MHTPNTGCTTRLHTYTLNWIVMCHEQWQINIYISGFGWEKILILLFALFAERAKWMHSMAQWWACCHCVPMHCWLLLLLCVWCMGTRDGNTVMHTSCLISRWERERERELYERSFPFVVLRQCMRSVFGYDLLANRFPFFYSLPTIVGTRESCRSDRVSIYLRAWVRSGHLSVFIQFVEYLYLVYQIRIYSLFVLYFI